ncbi:tRNA1(Val) (adenine(37)-N6)-methyltransferase [Companilactobacillus furfuricola]|uniref:tRNA1(Val) (adenine(37)-N6)-methyltransferase n=1 Tax=Companilactobacillus furfuricola TaxID=1462575 RepID=UPI000F76C6A2|nr:methyltransferase [Companilactobacillus furfuricola]
MTKISRDIIAKSGIVINQDKDLYSFNLDTILLYNFAKPAKKGKIVDLCSGNGAIGLTLAAKTSAKIYLVELQKPLADLAQASITDNKLDDQVKSINTDVKDVLQYLDHDTIDTIVCNPPYFAKSDQTKIKESPVLAIARHELKTNINEILHQAMILLKENSHLFMVFRPDRLVDLLSAMKANQLQPKRIRFVRSHKTDVANLVLVDGIKTHKSSSLMVLPDLVMYDGNVLSREAKEILNE